ncbi:helix-turn-helix domain-containing protein [Acidimangrovimonas sediminis]|uniref:helix-turn-helix domain-containing protein n=1 Tax=Acidimangrovimonas sediminis TaxID=2056283 RepID=UPI000C80FF3C|nr:helix-turn-helix transcriptional regulator [Acidimangrovimonas sediminis]
MTDESTNGGWYSEEAATFGDRLAGAREAAGMTQEDFAQRLGVKLKTVHGWEEDLREPRANKLQMMAGMLNVSIMWLLTGRGEGLDGPVEPERLDPSAERLLTDLRKARTDAQDLAERIGRMEKRLRTLLKENPL